MKSFIKALSLLLAVCLFVCLGALFFDKTDETAEKEIAETSSDYTFPKESDFSFSCNIQNPIVKKGENIVITCTLKNESDRDFFVFHGSEAITFSYNGESEMLRLAGA